MSIEQELAWLRYTVQRHSQHAANQMPGAA